MKRKIIKIDHEKCDGCGLCVPACHERAIAIINGKATLVKDSYCDGLGDCLGECPQDAITFETREAEAYDEEAVQERLKQRTAPPKEQPASPPGKPYGGGGGCPGMAAFSFGDEKDHKQETQNENKAVAGPESELRQWPVQLKLVPVHAPYWDQADLLIAADCVPTAYADFHAELLRDRRLVIACPKLDDTSSYADKLAAILSENDVRSVTVAIMEVPCCGGLDRIVQQAVASSGRDIPVKTLIVGVQGDLNEKTEKRLNGMALSL